MKKLILAILLIPSTAFSAPFLVSDPHSACGTSGLPDCPVACEIFADGVSIADNHAIESDMSIKYDLVTMPTAEVKYEAKFIDAKGRKSQMATPFILLKPTDAPQGLSLSP